MKEKEKPKRKTSQIIFFLNPLQNWRIGGLEDWRKVKLTMALWSFFFFLLEVEEKKSVEGGEILVGWRKKKKKRASTWPKLFCFFFFSDRKKITNGTNTGGLKVDGGWWMTGQGGLWAHHPDLDCAIVAGRGKHPRVYWVPAHWVHWVLVTFKHIDQLARLSVPDVNIWIYENRKGWGTQAGAGNRKQGPTHLHSHSQWRPHRDPQRFPE